MHCADIPTLQDLRYVLRMFNGQVGDHRRAGGRLPLFVQAALSRAGPNVRRTVLLQLACGSVNLWFSERGHRRIRIGRTVGLGGQRQQTVLSLIEMFVRLQLPKHTLVCFEGDRSVLPFNIWRLVTVCCVRLLIEWIKIVRFEQIAFGIGTFQISFEKLTRRALSIDQGVSGQSAVRVRRSRFAGRLLVVAVLFGSFQA